MVITYNPSCTFVFGNFFGATHVKLHLERSSRAGPPCSPFSTPYICPVELAFSAAERSGSISISFGGKARGLL